MVDANNEAHGYGRVIETGKSYFREGQFHHGKAHGYIR